MSWETHGRSTTCKPCKFAWRRQKSRGLVVILSPQAMTDPTGVAQALAKEITSRAKPVFAVWMGGQTWPKG